MQHSALAEQFNQTGASLSSMGHRVVVRKARAFIEAGALDKAIGFLEAAEQAVGRSARPLTEAARAFAAAGGDVEALLADPAWKAGTEADNAIAIQIAAATTGDLGTLARNLETLAQGGEVATPSIAAAETPAAEPVAESVAEPIAKPDPAMLSAEPSPTPDFGAPDLELNSAPPAPVDAELSPAAVEAPVSVPAPASPAQVKAPSQKSAGVSKQTLVLVGVLALLALASAAYMLL